MPRKISSQGNDKNGNAQPNVPNQPITWKAAEFEFREKSVAWYAAAGIIALILIVIALWQRNFFFAIFTLLAAVFLMVSGKRRPPVTEFTVSDRGVRVGERRYEYDRFRNFAIRNRPGHLDEIVLFQHNAISINIRLPIDSNLVEKVKPVLLEKLEFIEYQESLVDLLAERLGL